MAYKARLSDFQQAVYVCIGETLVVKYSRQQPVRREMVEIFSPHIVEGYERPFFVAAKHVVRTHWEAIRRGAERTYGTCDVPEVHDMLDRLRQLNPELLAEIELEG